MIRNRIPDVFSNGKPTATEYVDSTEQNLIRRHHAESFQRVPIALKRRKGLGSKYLDKFAFGTVKAFQSKLHDRSNRGTRLMVVELKRLQGSEQH